MNSEIFHLFIHSFRGSNWILPDVINRIRFAIICLLIDRSSKRLDLLYVAGHYSGYFKSGPTPVLIDAGVNLNARAN